MRIWSVHPKYLDTIGLVALWRETLLAKHVLEGKTKGYKNHPQLNRFKKSDDPVALINKYLSFVYDEAVARNYNFDHDKFISSGHPISLPVTRGQIEYEFNHLCVKLQSRNPDLFKVIQNIKVIEPHPLFVIIDGDVEDWEVRNISG